MAYLRCPGCGGATLRVLQVRDRKGVAVRWRRRACTGCGQRVTTREVVLGAVRFGAVGFGNVARARAVGDQARQPGQRAAVAETIAWQGTELRTMARIAPLTTTAEVLGRAKATVGAAAQRLGLSFQSYRRRRVVPRGRY